MKYEELRKRLGLPEHSIQTLIRKFTWKHPTGHGYKRDYSEEQFQAIQSYFKIKNQNSTTLKNALNNVEIEFK